MDNLVRIAAQFTQGQVINVQALGSGNINDTYLVTVDAQAESYFVLQRINTQIFRQPELVMQNIRVLTQHVHKRLQHVSFSGDRYWEMPRLLPTQNQDYWITPEGSFWRALSFINDSQSFDTIEDIKHATEVGYALGMFHTLISDLPVERLADTLAGFHITPRYLQQYDQVLAQSCTSKSLEVNYCLQFVSARRTWVHVLEDAKAQRKLPLRPMHGDPKINNVMINTETGNAISIVDLDTIKPGLVHYDIGDCLRSGCNPLGEETEQWEAVRFELELGQAILQSYLSQAKFLTENDHEYIYDAIRLISFELGLRFLTDYLAGNVYFKVRYQEHNLARALVQFKLTESIESQATAIRAIVQDLK